MTPLFEVCVEGAANAVLAAQAGADRVELCAALPEGGLTPTPWMLRATLQAIRLPVMAMLRPRGGNFVWSPQEIEIMHHDAGWIAEAGAAGLVLGCLTPEGDVDVAALRRLLDTGLEVTFHRAFDVVRDPLAALEVLIDCGVSRVLTSGQATDGVAGIAMLRRLVERADERITVLACGGLRPHNIGRVRQETGVNELHFAAPLQGDMSVTDPDLVRATIAAGRQ
jgi:copper homeostasis protein